MTNFETLRSEHNRLLELQQEKISPLELLPEVKEYCNNMRESGQKIFSPRERDQLRSFLRYWANYIYENQESTDKTYPIIDLYPYSGIPIFPMNNKLRLILGLIIITVIIILAIIFLPNPSNNPILTSETPGNDDTTVVPIASLIAASSQTAAAENATSSETPNLKESATPTEKITNSFDFTLTPDAQTSSQEPILATTTANVTYFDISSPANGSNITPNTTFQGKFENLRPGWSIHVLLQPLSRNGPYFPLPEYYIIPENVTSGIWKIEAQLEKQFSIDQPDTYVVTIIVSNNNILRQKIASAASTGLDQIPEQAIYIENTIITVKRPAYQKVSEIRLLYSSYLESEANYEIFIAKPDGSDPYRLTYTNDISEISPSLSPDGKSIAYVAKQLTNIDNESNTYSIWIMDSDGRNRTLLLDNGTSTIERPQWSPDGQFLAYGAQTGIQETENQWNIFVLDIANQASLIQSGEPLQITESRASQPDFISGRYPNWLDNETIIFERIINNNKLLMSIKINTFDIKEFFSYEDMVSQASLSSDKSSLAFIHYKPGEKENTNIYIANIKSNTVTQITDSTENKTYPTWHPDGKTIYYVTQNEVNSAIFSAILTTEGISPEQQITHPQKNDFDNTPHIGYFDAFLPIIQ